MLRTVAIVLLMLWVIASVSGYGLGGAIHLLLLVATLLYLVQRRIEANKVSVQEVSPAGILSIVLRRAQEDPGQAARDRWSIPPR
jgi:uncharacterized protein (DUF58 family)